MSPRTGRPPTGDATKTYETRIRMSPGEKSKLEHCCNFYGLTKAQVIRLGIDEMYEKSLEDLEKATNKK